jgi:predicted phosphodiesterase
MRLAVIGDIHGYDAALDQALARIAGLGCERIVSVGDLIDGHPRNERVVTMVRAIPGLVAVRGNHDELPLDDVSAGNRAWLLALPERERLASWDVCHYSPRAREEKINSVHRAWNAFDDGDFTDAVVGHAHIGTVYRYRLGMGAAAEELAGWNRDLPLEDGYRHIVVNPSLAYNRGRLTSPAFSVIDTSARTVRFVSLELPPISDLMRR